VLSSNKSCCSSADEGKHHRDDHLDMGDCVVDSLGAADVLRGVCSDPLVSRAAELSNVPRTDV
jgi:hypothetical protein